MPNKILLTEYFQLCPNGICNIGLLNESEIRVKEGGATLLTGILQVADEKNGNQRIYNKRILARENENYQKLIRERRAYGELDHPDAEVVSLKNASHAVIRTFWDDNKLMGVIQLLPTESGKQAKAIVESGFTLGISSRGLGSLRQTRDGMLVEDDFILICYDLVSEASAPGAYMHLQENKLININEVLTKGDRIFRSLNQVLNIGKK